MSHGTARQSDNGPNTVVKITRHGTAQRDIQIMVLTLLPNCHMARQSDNGPNTVVKMSHGTAVR